MWAPLASALLLLDRFGSATEPRRDEKPPNYVETLPQSTQNDRYCLSVSNFNWCRSVNDHRQFCISNGVVVSTIIELSVFLRSAFAGWRANCVCKETVGARGSRRRGRSN